jgi:hypothetical protein
MAYVDTNGPLPAMAMAFPDVCNTPMGPVVVPIPYPNIAMKIMAIPDQFEFIVMCFPSHDISVIIPLTQGDDAGVLLGEMSGTVMGPCEYMDGSQVLLVGGVPATMLAASTMQNSTDAFGVEVAPTQTVLATV